MSDNLCALCQKRKPTLTSGGMNLCLECMLRNGLAEAKEAGARVRENPERAPMCRCGTRKKLVGVTIRGDGDVVEICKKMFEVTIRGDGDVVEIYSCQKCCPEIFGVADSND